MLINLVKSPVASRPVKSNAEIMAACMAYVRNIRIANEVAAANQADELNRLNGVVNVDNITADMIAEAIAKDDINAALFPLQDAAGITDGDNAGAFFSDGRGEAWATAAQDERRVWIGEYIALERSLTAN